MTCPLTPWVAELGFKLGPWVYLLYSGYNLPKECSSPLEPRSVCLGRCRWFLHYRGGEGCAVFAATSLPSCYVYLSRFFLLQVTETQCQRPEHEREFAAHRSDVTEFQDTVWVIRLVSLCVSDSQSFPPLAGPVSLCSAQPSTLSSSPSPRAVFPTTRQRRRLPAAPVHVLLAL